LRAFSIWKDSVQRKLSFGTQSNSGSRFLERILTISETCRRQKTSAYDFLVKAMEVNFAGQPAPMLTTELADIKAA